MKITPRTEDYFKSRNLMDPGIYNFVVVHAEEKRSKTSGDEMIEVVLKVNDINGREHKVFDYLMDKEPMDYKIRHIYQCADLLNKYESGEISASDLVNVVGKVKIQIRKDKTGQYGDKNVVQDYLVDKNSNLEFNDTIPF